MAPEQCCDVFCPSNGAEGYEGERAGAGYGAVEAARLRVLLAGVGMYDEVAVVVLYM